METGIFRKHISFREYCHSRGSSEGPSLTKGESILKTMAFFGFAYGAAVLIFTSDIAYHRFRISRTRSIQGGKAVKVSVQEHRRRSFSNRDSASGPIDLEKTRVKHSTSPRDSVVPMRIRRNRFRTRVLFSARVSLGSYDESN